jgi:hypothetical protein
MDSKICARSAKCLRQKTIPKAILKKSTLSFLDQKVNVYNFFCNNKLKDSSRFKLLIMLGRYSKNTLKEEIVYKKIEI